MFYWGTENFLLLNPSSQRGCQTDIYMDPHAHICTRRLTDAGHSLQWSQLSQEMAYWIKRTDAKNQTLLACSHEAWCWLTAVYSMTACVSVKCSLQIGIQYTWIKIKENINNFRYKTECQEVRCWKKMHICLRNWCKRIMLTHMLT